VIGLCGSLPPAQFLLGRYERGAMDINMGYSSGESQGSEALLVKAESLHGQESY
jgi:hypothetical protein